MTKGIGFHEQVVVTLDFERALTPGETNRQLRTLGFTLHYDVYSMGRPDPPPHPNWQSEILVNIDMVRDGDEVDAQDAADAIRLRYPLARLDSPMMDRFVEVVEAVQARFGGKLYIDGKVVNCAAISAMLTACASELMQEWGEEPGSEILAMMIEGVI